MTEAPTQTPDALGQAIEQVVAPAATAVDREGAFPAASIASLARAGVLGLLSAEEVGGAGQGPREAATVVERLAGACGSTAMIVMMHFAATRVIEAHGPTQIRQAIAAGQHLTTLAFSESGSRSHFWVPMSTAAGVNGQVRLDARKSWVTSAARADSYVWSSQPLVPNGAGPMTLWLVDSHATGLRHATGFDGLGLRGNGSVPIDADGALVPETAMLGTDGHGLDIALGEVLPIFQILNAAFSLGIMEAVTAETAAHLTGTRLAYVDRSLAQQQSVRMDFARMRLETDRSRALLLDTLTAVESGRADAMLRVLESKAAAAEAALQVTDMAMKVCGGAAFRKELGIERRFRDARAARVMAPTTDALLDLIGRATLGLPLFEEVIAR